MQIGRCASIKNVANSFRTENGELPEMEEVALSTIKDFTIMEDRSILTVCDNFITIYGLITWKKKFGGR